LIQCCERSMTIMENEIGTAFGILSVMPVPTANHGGMRGGLTGGEQVTSRPA
jgi:hypothetical protein